MTTQSAESMPASPAIAVQSSDAISAEVRETASRLGVAQYLQQVIDLTREIYGGFTDVSVSENPEIPDDTHIVFQVPVRCSIEEALDLDEEWGRRLRQIIPRSPPVYLTSVDFPYPPEVALPSWATDLIPRETSSKPRNG